MSAAPPLMRHQFAVLAHGEPSTLARIIAPFVVHDVLPRIAAGPDASGTRYLVSVEFTCAPDIAARIAQRLAAMPAVIEIAPIDATAPEQRAA